MASRDEYADTSRTGPGPSRAECMYDVDIAPATPAADKAMFPDGLNATRGAADIGRIVEGR